MPRNCGAVQHPRGLAPGDHLCWPYATSAELRAAVIEYFIEGVERDERLLWIGEGSEDELAAALIGWPAADDLRAAGVLQIRSATGNRRRGARFDAAGHLDGVRELTRQARAAGFDGLRLAADATPLAARPDDRHELVRYEAGVDATVAALPMVALCAYDERHLPRPTVIDLRTVHPLRRVDDGEPTGFSVHTGDAGALVVEGEVEFHDADRLARALQLAASGAGHEIRVDLSGLRFIAVRGVDALAGALAGLRRWGRRVTVTAAPAIVARCWELLGHDPGLIEDDPRAVSS